MLKKSRLTGGAKRRECQCQLSSLNIHIKIKTCQLLQISRASQDRGRSDPTSFRGVKTLRREHTPESSATQERKPRGKARKKEWPEVKISQTRAGNRKERRRQEGRSCCKGPVQNHPSSCCKFPMQGFVVCNNLSRTSGIWTWLLLDKRLLQLGQGIPN